MKLILFVRAFGNGQNAYEIVCICQSPIIRFFQPFSATKPTGQRTGLGLSLTYDIIKTHDCEIKIKSNEGAGSEFVILLPS